MISLCRLPHLPVEIASAPMVAQGATLFIALGRRVERDALHGRAGAKCGLQRAGECVLRARRKLDILCQNLHLVTGLAAMSCCRVTAGVVSRHEASSDVIKCMYSNVRMFFVVAESLSRLVVRWLSVRWSYAEATLQRRVGHRKRPMRRWTKDASGEVSCNPSRRTPEKTWLHG